TIRIQETGEEITIPKKISKSQPTNLDEEFSTEGSENHDTLTPNNNENNEDLSDTKANSGSKLISTNKATGQKFDFVSDAFIEYEKTPINKKGTKVTFEVTNDNLNNKNWVNAQKGYQKLLNGEVLNQKEIDFLVNHLPINAVITDNVKAPIETQPNTKCGIDIFNKSSKVLRTNLINTLISGVKLENISTTIEGQYGGVLIVDSKDENNNVRENNILDLYHFKGMTTKQKVDYIKKNIAIVNQLGNFEYLDGNTEPFINKAGKIKANAKGELYMMIPKANGVLFPLKLNIKKLNSGEQNNVIA